MYCSRANTTSVIVMFVVSIAKTNKHISLQKLKEIHPKLFCRFGANLNLNYGFKHYCHPDSVDSISFYIGFLVPKGNG